MRMHRTGRRRLILWTGLILGATTVAAAWFGGGGYDGYDRLRGGGAADFPQVHNAGGATDVTPVSARLHGMLVHTGAAPAKVMVFWGNANGGTDVQAWEQEFAFGGFGDVAPFTPLSHDIAVLESSTYYYRFFATNQVGQTGWAPETSIFVTPAPPAVTNGAGAAVSFSAAVLNGALIDGLEAEMWLDWSTADPDVSPAAWTVIDLGTRTEAGSAQAPNPFRVRITDLTPATTHAYRVRAENPYGTAASPWFWFTTHPADFSTVPDRGWFGGGVFDGYDREILFDVLLPGMGGATLLLLR